VWSAKSVSTQAWVQHFSFSCRNRLCQDRLSHETSIILRSEKGTSSLKPFSIITSSFTLILEVQGVLSAATQLWIWHFSRSLVDCQGVKSHYSELPSPNWEIQSSGCLSRTLLPEYKLFCPNSSRCEGEFLFQPDSPVLFKRSTNYTLQVRYQSRPAINLRSEKCCVFVKMSAIRKVPEFINFNTLSWDSSWHQIQIRIQSSTTSDPEIQHSGLNSSDSSRISITQPTEINRSDISFQQTLQAVLSMTSATLFWDLRLIIMSKWRAEF